MVVQTGTHVEVGDSITCLSWEKLNGEARMVMWNATVIRKQNDGQTT